MTDKPSTLTSLLLLLISVVVVLMIAVFALFIRMRQLELNISAVSQSISTLSEKEEPKFGLPIQTVLPKFSLTNVSDQSVYSSDSFIGQKTLLVFASPACSHCINLFPNLKAFSEQRNDLQIVLISFGTHAENKMIFEDQGFNFPVLNGDPQAALEVYLVPGTPFLYLVDEKMTILSSGFAETLDDLETLVGAAASQ